ncbi:SET and MYND domain-containing protein 4-like [Penaeus japonicus]|uniref:SET and MYND domain-containing protein 4-like n=1 Tax=Penaeus japonicus TaxID=27405 RepID=UPI001C70ECE7|nr:SET and MYND domain-containing protein 4-like [Penaeus japonicus]XP_042875595.1 SET and MYND domain-containing protein 4-like [Penaeus japonicus]XP_042875596.1 SET and MYND domain-containing protein 4-like [Penaeus japonicus]XP_042875597.1 SET and MYND domain-containing protein 4-like [Penaeus japonicus]XP_042875598.1 SET and MYND domain-containing protein 4-like [Penaeus japonicus]XP_042875599.1 SET and MYND domain-containing protein 4-like [Penaeus japonicus]
MAPFHELYAKFRHELQESWQTAEVTAHFGPTSTLDDMFRYLWCLPETFQLLTPPAGDPRISRKGAAEAERFRAEGNRFYREHKFDKALLAYNYSILAAPHPPVASEAPAAEHECLSLGYANRSALLLESGQFEAALADIERALESGYPASRAYRLLERRAKCLLAMGKAQDARKCIEEAVALLAGLSLSEKEKDSTRGAFAKLRAKCDGKGQTGGAARKNECLFYTGSSSPPAVLSPRPDAACMSAAVRVAYTPVRGRHLVADREILPGEVLIVEDSICAAVKPDGTFRTHCSHCLRRAPVPLPCPTCSLVVFCNERCRAAGLSGSHGGECAMLAALVSLKLDPAPLLAARILASTTLTQLKDTLGQLQANSTGVNKPLLEIAGGFRSLYHLEGHGTARSESQLQEVAAMAYVLTRVLLENSSSFLKNKEGNIAIPSLDDVVLVGGQFMRLILGLECNVHCMKEVETGGGGAEGGVLGRSRGREVGWAVYSALSLINHSCVPNALTSCLGSTKYLYSVSVIPCGAEITDSYGERYVSHARAKRRAELQQHYFFCCNCAACQADWPLFEDITIMPHLRCPSCFQKLTGFSCSLCDLVCNQDVVTQTGVRLYDAKKIQTDLTSLWTEYLEASKTIRNGKPSQELLSRVTDLLTILDRYTVHPNQAYITAQETLMTCFDLMGSVYMQESNQAKS